MTSPRKQEHPNVRQPYLLHCHLKNCVLCLLHGIGEQRQLIGLVQQRHQVPTYNAVSQVKAQQFSENRNQKENSCFAAAGLATGSGPEILELYFRNFKTF